MSQESYDTSMNTTDVGSSSGPGHAAILDGSLRDLLKRYFGFDEFMPLQDEVIAAVMARRDTLVLIPTGGGKSLCFQLPALALPGLTLVISPLIALMKDQVDALSRNGVPAALLNSTQTRSEQVRIQKLAYAGDLKLLYAAPERVASLEFQRFLRATDVSLIAIAEAHCISEWGHEFRPDYRDLKALRELKPEASLIALTATATQKVRNDIVGQLELRDPAVFIGSFNRPNLRYSVLRGDEAHTDLLKRLREDPTASAIVYRASRSAAEELAADLRAEGINALPYHAGLGDEERAANQDAFIRDRVQVIVATVAFGMGIDKPDVRLVAHFEMPPSIERYYQESGRAGRDGLPAECAVYFGAGEIRRQQYFLDRTENPTQRGVAAEKLRDMVRFCQSADCRRTLILEYFGEVPDGGGCGNCDVCLAETFDATVIAQKLLSAVIRTGQRFGATSVSQVLRGANTAAVRDRGHQALSVYGIVDDYSDAEMRQLSAMLAGRGLLRVGKEYPTPT